MFFHCPFHTELSAAAQHPVHFSQCFLDQHYAKAVDLISNAFHKSVDIGKLLIKYPDRFPKSIYANFTKMLFDFSESISRLCITMA